MAATIKIDFEVSESSLRRVQERISSVLADKAMRHELMLALINGADKQFVVHPDNEEYINSALNRLWAWINEPSEYSTYNTIESKRGQ